MQYLINIVAELHRKYIGTNLSLGTKNQDLNDKTSELILKTNILLHSPRNHKSPFLFLS